MGVVKQKNEGSEVKALHAQCPNCSAIYRDGDKFCSQCSQQRQDSSGFGAFLSDFMKDYFTFDSKMFRSVSPLLFRPGFLVNEYLAGRKVRYIPPLRIFLFSSIVFFLFFGIGVGNGSEAVGRELDYFFGEILPKLVLLFLPIFALIVQLFFGRGLGYLKHFLFSTYFHSFVFIIGVLYWAVSKLLQLIGAVKFNPILLLACLIWLLTYLWIALGKVYPKKKLGALMLRYCGILVMYGGLLVLAALVSVTLLLGLH